MSLKLNLSTADAAERYFKICQQRNAATKRFNLRNKAPVAEYKNKVYLNYAKNEDFKLMNRKTTAIYYDQNKDAIKEKAKIKRQLKKLDQMKPIDDNIIKIEPTELKLKRGRPKKIV